MIDRTPSMADELPAGLSRLTQLLRDTPEPSDIWRRRALDRVWASPPPGRLAVVRPARRRVFTLTPTSAIAAGLMCALLGGAVVAGTQRRSVQRPAVSLVSPVVRFTLDAPAANRVFIVGDFNGWNPTSLPLRRSRDGRTWEVEVPLAPGRYAYSFIVDGALARDPSAPRGTEDDFGTPNSILLVKGS